MSAARQADYAGAHLSTRGHSRAQATTYLVDEGVGPLRAEQQDSPAQCVPVAVQLLRLHCGEEAGEHVADVLVHLLQRDIEAQPRGLVQEALETTDI